MSDELLDLEHRGWEALSKSGEAAAAFYDEVLADEVLMLFPGGMVMDDRDEIIASMSGPPWESYEITAEWAIPLGEDAAVVAYRAVAVRQGDQYEALFNSTYVRTGESWKLAFHQQTPV